MSNIGINTKGYLPSELQSWTNIGADGYKSSVRPRGRERSRVGGQQEKRRTWVRKGAAASIWCENWEVVGPGLKSGGRGS